MKLVSANGPRISHQSQLLHNNFIIAEHSHSDFVPKDFLIQMLPLLAASGFTTLFMEHIFYDQQEKVDRLKGCRQLSQEVMSEHLDAINCSEADMHISIAKTKISYSEIIKKARSLEIKVIGLDLAGSYQMQSDFQGYCKFLEGYHSFRCNSLNYTACHIMNKENPSGKWVALIGIAHLKDLSRYTGALSVICNQDENKFIQNPIIEFNKEFKSGLAGEDVIYSSDVVITYGRKNFPIDSFVPQKDALDQKNVTNDSPLKNIIEKYHHYKNDLIDWEFIKEKYLEEKHIRFKIEEQKESSKRSHVSSSFFGGERESKKLTALNRMIQLSRSTQYDLSLMIDYNTTIKHGKIYIRKFNENLLQYAVLSPDGEKIHRSMISKGQLPELSTLLSAKNFDEEKVKVCRNYLEKILKITSEKGYTRSTEFEPFIAEDYITLKPLFSGVLKDLINDYNSDILSAISQKILPFASDSEPHSPVFLR